MPIKPYRRSRVVFEDVRSHLSLLVNTQRTIFNAATYLLQTPARGVPTALVMVLIPPPVTLPPSS